MYLRSSILLVSALLILACPADPGGDASSANSTCGDDGITDSCTDTAMSADGESGESETTSDTADGGDGDSDSNGPTETGGECAEDEDCEEEEMCDEGMCVPSCGDVSVVLNVPPPPVMLVLDKSGSMVNNVWDHDGDPATADETRWKTLYGVTDSILMNFESSIQFGLQLFPSENATTACANNAACPACDVAAGPEVELAINNREAILDAMPDADAGSSTVAGATPAAGGIVEAKSALDAAVAGGDTGPAIIFITDGAANCGLQYAAELCEFPGPTQTSADCKLMDYFDDELEGLIGSYNTDAADDINTYVVGIDIVDEVLDPTSAYDFKVDNTNVYEELNAIAVAGGAPQMGGAESFYNATNEAELATALDEIAGVLTSCEIDLSVPPNMVPEPSQVEYVEFSIDDVDVPFLEDTSEADCLAGVVDGWIWVIEGQTVLFCGSFCDSLKATLEVDGVYGCPEIG